MRPVLKFENVTKTYTMGEVSFQALENVNISINKGDFISIIGPSGSGKSTMLHLMGCLDKPTKGRILIDDQDISKMSESKLANIRGVKIGFIFQTFNLIPRFTALENVTIPMWFQNKESQEKKAIKLLEMVGLGHRINHRPSQLSGGERQRVSIARALANDPDIILADEPTGNLDTKSGDEVLKILVQLNKEYKTTLIIITHDMRISKLSKKRYHIIDGHLKDDKK